MNNIVSINELARSVKFADRAPTASIPTIESILDIALRSRIGISAMSSEGMVIELGNGYQLVCHTKKSEVPNGKTL